VSPYPTSSLGHGDVILTVADEAYGFPREGTDEPDYVGFLGEGATVGDYSRESSGKKYELGFVLV